MGFGFGTPPPLYLKKIYYFLYFLIVTIHGPVMLMINMYNDESTMHVIERKKGLFAHFLRDVLQVCVHALYTFL